MTHEKRATESITVALFLFEMFFIPFFIDVGLDKICRIIYYKYKPYYTVRVTLLMQNEGGEYLWKTRIISCLKRLMQKTSVRFCM